MTCKDIPNVFVRTRSCTVQLCNTSSPLPALLILSSIHLSFFFMYKQNLKLYKLKSYIYNLKYKTSNLFVFIFDNKIIDSKKCWCHSLTNLNYCLNTVVIIYFILLFYVHMKPKLAFSLKTLAHYCTFIIYYCSFLFCKYEQLRGNQ